MKKQFLKLIAITFMSLGISSAFADDAKSETELYAITDATTTIIGLSKGAVETNPMGPVAAIMLKPIVINMVDELPAEERKVTFNIISSVWGAATANNICVITGGASCAAVGLVYGAFLWIKNNEEKGAV